MTKRKSMSWKLRFEVFKRDKFTCQYCGRKAPEAILHADHITPVVAGGSNDPMNLVTSCDTCNGGKGPTALSDESAVEKRRAQTDQLQERRELIEMMAEWQNGLLDAETDELNAAAEYYKRIVIGWHLNETGLPKLRALLRKHGFAAVCAELRAVAGVHLHFQDGKVTPESAEGYFGRVERSLKWQADKAKDPVGSELRYIRGILRNHLNIWPNQMPGILEDLKEAHDAGIPVGQLRDIALSSRSMESWARQMAEAMDRIDERKR